MKNEVNKELTKSLTVTEAKFQEPALYRVFLYNDDFTPMEFVVGILENFFFMDRRKAIDIMMETHISGKGNCGVFSKEVAETKIARIMENAKENEYPLTCSMEAE